MITCGNCKERHTSAAEVRSCYGAPQSAPTPTNPAAPATRTFVTNAATPKQVAFIETLCQERNLPVPSGLSKPEASALITQLLSTPKTAPAESPGVAIAATAAQQLDGTYTVVMPDGDWTTIRFREATWAKDLPAGSRVVEYLSGSDNNVDYTGFAFMVNGKARIWGKYKNGNSAPVQALAGLITATEESLTACHEQFLQLAEGYALKSGRCMRCGHTLTVPASLHRGLGPICAAAEGVA